MGYSQGRQRTWVDTASQLREVRRACLLFLDRWAIGHLLAEEMEARADEAMNDFANRDWSMFYRGSVLDD